ncbi:MAG: hypothetical protein RL120_03615, partial [Gammaproteobacteria bacterium]
ATDPASTSRWEETKPDSVTAVTSAWASVADAYQALTEDIARWWDAEHSYSGVAANFSLQARAGGCFCEKLPNGGEVEHLRVVFADPAGTLRLNGGLGPLQEMAVSGSMIFTLRPRNNNETELSYTYSVSGFVPGGLDVFADPVDQVQLGQLRRLQAYLAAR